jgi:hypothetical protein
MPKLEILKAELHKASAISEAAREAKNKATNTCEEAEVAWDTACNAINAYCKQGGVMSNLTVREMRTISAASYMNDSGNEMFISYAGEVLNRDGRLSGQADLALEGAAVKGVTFFVTTNSGNCYPVQEGEFKKELIL